MFGPAAGPVIDYGSSQLESSSCGQFFLCKDKWIGYGVPSSWYAIDACVLVLNQYVTVECNKSIFMTD